MRHDRPRRPAKPVPPRHGFARGLLMQCAGFAEGDAPQAVDTLAPATRCSDGVPYALWIEHNQVMLLATRDYIVEMDEWDARRGVFRLFTGEVGLVALPHVRRLITFSWRSQQPGERYRPGAQA